MEISGKSFGLLLFCGGGCRKSFFFGGGGEVEINRNSCF